MSAISLSGSEFDSRTDASPEEAAAAAALEEWQETLLGASLGGIGTLYRTRIPPEHGLQDMQLLNSIAEGAQALGVACSNAVELPTLTQDRFEYIMIQRLVLELRKIANDQGGHVARNVLFGSLPTGYPDAQTLQVPRTNFYLVAFNSGLFGYLYQLGRIVATMIPYERTSEGIAYQFSLDRLEESPQKSTAAGQLTELLYATLVKGTPWESPPFRVRRYQIPLATSLVDSSHAFVVGHEIAHIQGGHLLRARVERHALGSTTGTFLDYDWDDELEADFVGMQHAFALCQQRPHPTLFSFAGAQVYLGGVQLLGMAHAQMNGQNEDASRYEQWPPLPRRLKALHGGLEYWLDSVPEWLDRERAFARAVDFIIQDLWHSCRDEIGSRLRGNAATETAWDHIVAKPVEGRMPSPIYRLDKTYDVLEGAETSRRGRELALQVPDALALTLIQDAAYETVDRERARSWLSRLGQDSQEVSLIKYRVLRLDPRRAFGADPFLVRSVNQIAQQISQRYSEGLQVD